jgi:hypothetical protein
MAGISYVVAWCVAFSDFFQLNAIKNGPLFNIKEAHFMEITIRIHQREWPEFSFPWQDNRRN